MEPAMSRSYLFDVPILDREFKVMIAPEPLNHRVEVDTSEEVIWIDPREPRRTRAEAAAHGVALAASLIVRVPLVPYDD
jgi:hypothetical protein